MPKDEFDFDDPMELTGVALFTDEDTTDAMCECFIEEFMMLGYDHARIFALFRHPHYIGMNMVLQNRGEQFVRDRISEIFAQWGRPVTWSVATPFVPKRPPPARVPIPAPAAPPKTSCSCGSTMGCCSEQKPPEPEPGALDPTGSPAPTYNL